MTGHSQAVGPGQIGELCEAVKAYFDLMHDCDTSRFDQVFRPTVQLHGYRDGEMLMWSAPAYRDVLDRRQSPKSLGAARFDEILLMDFASDTMALVKVRLRIGAQVFVDYLTWHQINGRWLVTSKGYHIEAESRPIQA